MAAESELSILQDFFDANFHEDWDLDDATTDEVVSDYLSSATSEQMTALSTAILEYIRRSSSEEELADKLFRELGCYFMPNGQEVSASEWLRGISTAMSVCSKQSP